MTQQERFEAHWHNMRGKKAAIRELERHPLQPQTYVQDSANRHWVTWQAAQAQAAAPTHRTTGFMAPVDRYAVPVLFNPYTGEPRDVRDVQSDPQGILIVPPGKVELLAAKSAQAAEHQPCPDGSPCKHGHWCTEVYCQGIPCFRDQYKAAVEPVGKVLEVAEDGSFQTGFFEELPVGTLLYTADAIAAARVQALEEAVKVCEGASSYLEHQQHLLASRDCANAIRALIGGAT